MTNYDRDTPEGYNAYVDQMTQDAVQSGLEDTGRKQLESGDTAVEGVEEVISNLE